MIALDVKKARDSHLEKLICDNAVADIELNFDTGSRNRNYFCDIEINIDRAEITFNRRRVQVEIIGYFADRMRSKFSRAAEVFKMR